MSRLAILLLIALLVCIAFVNASEISASSLPGNVAHVSTTQWTVIDSWIDHSETLSKMVHNDADHGYSASERAPADTVLTMTVVLNPKESSVVSSSIDPASPQVQKFSTNELEDMAANTDGNKLVIQHFNSHGMEANTVNGKVNYVSVTAPIHAWEKALNAQFHVFRNPRSPTTLIRTKEYSFPSHIAPHVQEILNAIEIPAPIGGIAMTKRQETIRSKRAESLKIAQQQSTRGESLLESTVPPVVISPIR